MDDQLCFRYLQIATELDRPLEEPEDCERRTKGSLIHQKEASWVVLLQRVSYSPVNFREPRRTEYMSYGHILETFSPPGLWVVCQVFNSVLKLSNL